MYELTYAERVQYKRRQDTAYQAGHDAVSNLRAALALADLTLPSLSNDGPVAGHGFVRLGGCNATFANRLAEVVAAGAYALQYQTRAGKVERPREGLQRQRSVHDIDVGDHRISRAEAPAAPDPIVAFLLAVRDPRHPARLDRMPTPAH
ncbi:MULTISPECIES: hypothetical protein [Streptomyces]|uniref:Uncharacterized protein n=1 Tax=Streptomyces virginiae TaxID=1961 RepID=A0ABQ3NPU2_STRVG|nr:MULTISPECIES: hypothetical protein [Streptomyces]MCI4079073.1 hypothetical protein [Streptomyces sp. MMS21 TC-5]GGQ07610.1 hypothetical protein GCM10010215_36170 [Streptomyces virginiae]GHI14795.1 hypothetical protein Scinn_42580 [Streptomyces virginiae]GLV92708.1 hypothetical protein Slala04_41620 [Streptomyces lavendulae subsp. lavendulae]